MSARADRRPSREERREALLVAAVDAIRGTGASVSMEQLAAAGGVSKPILYRHFGDRSGLVSAIGERIGGRLLDRILGTLDAQESPQDLLRRTIDGYLQFLEEDPELYAFLIRHAQAGSAGDAVNSLVETISRRVSVVLGDRIREVGGDAGAAEPWGFGVVGMVHQTGDWWIKTRTMSRAAVTDYLTALLWNGFGGLAAEVDADD